MASNVLISTHAITKSYGAQPLFSDISLPVCASERLGLIGPNGAGKSTLLKILAGIESIDAGDLSRKRGVRIVYLPQQDVLDAGKTIAQTLLQAVPETFETWQRDKRQQEIQSLIGMDDMNRKVETLSGGWRKRVAIGRALFEKPDLLLMDEPTNHLDLEGILWLEAVLQQAPFAFVLVTHDRFFLENTTNRTVELDRRYPQGFLKVEGNYSVFVEKRENFLQQQANLETVLSNKVRREIEWLRRGAKARSTKAKYRIDKAYQLQEDLAEVRGRNAGGRSVDITFDATGRKTKILLEARDLGVSAGGKRLFAHLDLKLAPATILGVMGRNGTGKSTLIQVLNGQRVPDAGCLKVAEGLRVVTFDQKRELSNPDQSLRQALAPEGDTVLFQDRPFHVTAWAKRFLFKIEQLGMPVAGLSGGEKARVLIANLMRQPADILLLDEPANDLDIPTLQVLEESLEEFAGAIVLITHDRFLMERLCHRLLYLDGEGGTRFFADYSQWLEHRQDRTTAASPPAKTASGPVAVKPGKQAREARKDLERIQRQIERAEETAGDLQRQLHDPAIQSNAGRLAELYAAHQEALEKVDQLYRQWEQLEAESAAVP